MTNYRKETNIHLENFHNKHRNAEIQVITNMKDIFYNNKLNNGKVENRKEKIIFITTPIMEEKIKIEANI